VSRFLADRWQGRVALSRLLWRDMLAVGTSINLLAGFGALMWLAQGGTAGVALAVHLAPLPWCGWLLACLWRHPARRPGHRALGLAWMAVMLVV
jgi:hypothetical protein